MIPEEFKTAVAGEVLRDTVIAMAICFALMFVIGWLVGQ